MPTNFVVLTMHFAIRLDGSQQSILLFAMALNISQLIQLLLLMESQTSPRWLERTNFFGSELKSIVLGIEDNGRKEGKTLPEKLAMNILKKELWFEWVCKTWNTLLFSGS